MSARAVWAVWAVGVVVWVSFALQAAFDHVPRGIVICACIGCALLCLERALHE